MVTFSIPGKTFLIGEYAVLQGGNALIACTEPCFMLTAEAAEGFDSKKIQHPFHPASPAGKWTAQHPEVFERFQLTWTSPYADGGFGGSTAEFLACCKLYHYEFYDFYGFHGFNLNPAELITIYQKLCGNQSGISPSGADLIAQNYEKIVYFQAQLNQNDLNDQTPICLDWPFLPLSLCLFKTPGKLPTHDHLKSLEYLPDLTSLASITLEAYEALQQHQAEYFIRAVNLYAHELEKLRLTSDAALHYLHQLRQHPACRAVKGCGAMGADVIAAVVDQNQEESFKAYASELNLKSIAGHRELFKKPVNSD